jgi:MSHA biogenesis protein MshN
MSVVNKMLQDLEARKSQPDEINADYQPPQKKQLKWIYLVLLLLAITAISFSLLNINQLFGTTDNNNHDDMANDPVQIVTQKPMDVAQVIPSNQESNLKQPETLTTASVSQNTETVAVVLATADEVEDLSTPERQVLLIEPTNIPVVVKNQQSEEQASSSPLTQAQAQPKQTSFSMSGSSKENQTTSLKQRIAESLNSNDVDLAQSLLSQLLLDEPDNLKARKKLASLYFAQGNHAQTKQLLLSGIDLHPNQTDLKLMLARLYSVQDNPEQALKVMLGVEPNISNQTEFLAYRAALAQQLKQPLVAKADYIALSALDATNAKWWLGLGVAHDQLAETNNAIKAYEKAYSLGQLDDSVDEFIQQRILVLAGTR